MCSWHSPDTTRRVAAELQLKDHVILRFLLPNARMRAPLAKALLPDMDCMDRSKQIPENGIPGCSFSGK
jgi:hypothetical protein